METESLNTLIGNLNSLDTDNSIPQWALLMIECMKTLITEIKGVNDIIKRVHVLEDFKSVNEAVSMQLNNENIRLIKVVNDLETKLDDQEQRTRNSCLLIHGIEEDESDNTDNHVLSVINDLMGLSDITIDDIQRSHRLGPKTTRRNTRSANVKPRPIIMKFLNFRKRQLVFKNKSSLKGKKIAITENLTRIRYSLYMAAMAKFGKGNVWTSEGRVMSKANDKILIINSTNDLD